MNSAVTAPTPNSATVAGPETTRPDWQSEMHQGRPLHSGNGFDEYAPMGQTPALV